jgi:hypothetical protein
MPVTRKVGFYSIRLLNNIDDGEVVDVTKLKEILKYILEHKREDRKRAISDNRFYFLDEVVDCNSDSDIQVLVFKYAEHGRRPPLINKDTLEERDNPREMEEGELERTHVGFRYTENEIIVILEEVRTGVTIGRLVYYLEYFLGELYNQLGAVRNYSIKHSIVAKDDFSQELKKLSRVHVGYISMSKSLLGSEFLDLSDRTEQVRSEIVIEVKAERKKTIKGVFLDVYNKFLSTGESVSKIRVYGIDDDQNSVILDTDLIKQVQHLEFEKDIYTGEINSQELIDRLTQILLSL